MDSVIHVTEGRAQSVAPLYDGEIFTNDADIATFERASRHAESRIADLRGIEIVARTIYG